MAALDTNVLVRYIEHGDNSSQHVAARKLVNSALLANDTFFIPITVTLELEWILRSAFKYSKRQAIDTLFDLMASVELSFQFENAAEIALVSYDEGAADFADYVHIALSHLSDNKPMWTFDKVASKAVGAKLLASH